MHIVWHYTVAAHLPSIYADGEIRPATAGVPRGEKPAVWFSANPTWEPTANKSVVEKVGGVGRVRCGTKADTEAIGGGLSRIAVAETIAPHDWKAFCRLSGITARAASLLRSAAYQAGAKPSEWRVSFDPVPREKWLAVEVWVGGAWVPFGPVAKGQ